MQEKMKYIVILGDGMADYPVPELGGKTPLETAYKPNMDMLAQKGSVGMVKTIPDGMPPGSDTANLSVMGYSPEKFYSGRSPLEAASIGIALKEGDVTFRCNLVTLSDEENFEDTTMVDYSSGEITTAESAELIRFLQPYIENEFTRLYPGVSYRHCLVLENAQTGSICTPPHDISLKPIKDYLPSGTYGDMLLSIMKRSRELLKDHPINKKRIAEGKNPATSCWFWGEGTKPALLPFEEVFGIKGGVISAVDLIKGIGICAGMNVRQVEGATGTYKTNFKGKAEAALELLRGDCDLVYIHMEAPDECGHQHDVEGKVRSIELIDREVIGRLLDGLTGPYRMLVLPDHPTPLTIRTHVADPVPFILYSSEEVGEFSAPAYDEVNGGRTGWFVPEGPQLMRLLLGKSEQ